jgi:hypothetical protein
LLGPWSGGKGKATPSGARKRLVGLKFLAIRSQPADGGKSLFFKEFNDRIAIRDLGRSDSVASVALV